MTFLDLEDLSHLNQNGQWCSQGVDFHPLLEKKKAKAKNYLKLLGLLKNSGYATDHGLLRKKYRQILNSNNYFN